MKSREETRTLLMKEFRAAVLKAAEESRKSYEATRIPTLRKGVPALLKRIMNHNPMDLTGITTEDQVVHIVDTVLNGNVWRVKADENGRVQAIKFIWGFLAFFPKNYEAVMANDKAAKQVSEIDAAWAAHRANQP